MKKRVLASLVLCLFVGLAVHTVEAAGITKYEKFINPEFWAQRNPKGEELVLDDKGVKNYNLQIREKSKTVVDLKNFPAVYDGEALKTKIMNYVVLEEDLFLRGNKISDNFKNILRQQTNTTTIPSKIKVQYAVTVRRSSLRTLPTGEAMFAYAGDQEFDMLQETALDPGEPVIVLHTSANGYFHYVQARNYCGWISKFNIAFTNKNNWTKYLEPKKFLVVTGKELPLKIGAEVVKYQQGSVLPIMTDAEGTYTLLAAGRSKDGKYAKMTPMVRKDNANINVGYLPYTSNNIIRSAFKFYDAPYGWGGLKDSVDCSSLMYNAYRTVGIYLPRNADEQEKTAGKIIALEGKNKASLIKDLQPGAGLFMDGHVLMYLGTSSNTPYAIHALSGYMDKGSYKKAMKVVVSDLSLQRGDGNTHMTHLTNAVEFK